MVVTLKSWEERTEGFGTIGLRPISECVINTKSGTILKIKIVWAKHFLTHGSSNPRDQRLSLVNLGKQIIWTSKIRESVTEQIIGNFHRGRTQFTEFFTQAPVNKKKTRSVKFHFKNVYFYQNFIDFRFEYGEKHGSKIYDFFFENNRNLKISMSILTENYNWNIRFQKWNCGWHFWSTNSRRIRRGNSLLKLLRMVSETYDSYNMTHMI